LWRARPGSASYRRGRRRLEHLRGRPETTAGFTREPVRSRRAESRGIPNMPDPGQYIDSFARIGPPISGAGSESRHRHSLQERHEKSEGPSLSARQGISASEESQGRYPGLGRENRFKYAAILAQNRESPMPIVESRLARERLFHDQQAEE